MSLENLQSVPVDGEDVTIDSPVLFSGESARLGRVTVVSGGRLVFDPASTVLNKLTANSVLIDDEGKLEIGAEDPKCWYKGQAEIMLTGIFFSSRKSIIFKTVVFHCVQNG